MATLQDNNSRARASKLLDRAARDSSAAGNDRPGAGQIVPNSGQNPAKNGTCSCSQLFCGSFGRMLASTGVATALAAVICASIFVVFPSNETVILGRDADSGTPGTHAKLVVAFIAAEVSLVPVFVALSVFSRFWSCRYSCVQRSSTAADQGPNPEAKQTDSAFNNGLSQEIAVPALTGSAKPNELASESSQSPQQARAHPRAADTDRRAQTPNAVGSGCCSPPQSSLQRQQAAQAAAQRHRDSVFHWIAGGRLPPSMSRSRFVAELLSVMWFAAGMYAILGALVEIFIPAQSVPALVAQQALFGRATTAHMTLMGLYTLHVLDAQCDDVLQAGSPTGFRRWWWSCGRRVCGCRIATADRWLDGARHGYTGIAVFTFGRVFESLSIMCPTGVLSPDAPGLGSFVCTDSIVAVRLLGIAGLGLYTLLLGWGARMHVVQVGVTRIINVVVVCTGLVGYPLVWVVPHEIISLGNTFLAGAAIGIVFPAAVYITMINEESSRVDAATQFLQYMTHQVRGPSTSAGLALRQVQGELDALKAFMGGAMASKELKLRGTSASSISTTGSSLTGASSRSSSRGGGRRSSRSDNKARAPPATALRASSAGRVRPSLGRTHPLGLPPAHSDAAAPLAQTALPAPLRAELPPWLIPLPDKPTAVQARRTVSAGNDMDDTPSRRLGGGMVRSHSAARPRSVQLSPITLPRDDGGDPLASASPPSPHSIRSAPVAAPFTNAAKASLAPRAAVAPWVALPPATTAQKGDASASSSASHDSSDSDALQPLGGQAPVDSPLQAFLKACVRRLGDTRNAARDAGASLSAVTALLDRTLDLARLEAGHGGVQPSRFQVSALWSDVVRAVAPAYRESGVRLHFKVGDVAVTADRRVAFPSIWQSQAAASAWVLGDRLRLHQSLVALLDNGARYTPRGGHVRVSLDVVSLSAGSDLGALGITQDGLERQLDTAAAAAGWHDAGDPTAAARVGGMGRSGHMALSIDDSAAGADKAAVGVSVQRVTEPLALRVTVADTGRGIDAAQQARLFLPFARLHAEGSGTGLGLNIAKRAMRAHGGDVRVASGGAGQGSTFTLSALTKRTSAPHPMSLAHKRAPAPQRFTGQSRARRNERSSAESKRQAGTGSARRGSSPPVAAADSKALADPLP